MFGIKNDSKIIRLKRPETKVGRNRTNNVVLAKSLKISRYHAVIRFFDDLPFIKDVSDDKLSEWGVFINGTALLRNRWVEIQVGDVVAFGDTRTEEGGCITEIVDLEPEEDEPTDFNNVATQRPPSINAKLETIDISTDVIDLDDEENIQNEGQITPGPSSVPTVETTNNGVASSILCISDDDDDDEIHFTFPTSTTVPDVTETKPLDVTPTMNGLLKLPSVKSAPLSPPSIPLATPSNDDIENQLAAVVGLDTPMNILPIPTEIDVKPAAKLPIVKQEYQFQDTQELQNILNYSMPDEIISLDSDEEDFPSSQLNATCVADTPDYSSTFSMMYELKSEVPSDDEDIEFVGSDSWFGPLSQTISDVKSEMSKSWRTSDKVSEHVELPTPMDIDPTSVEANEALPNEFNDTSHDDVDLAESTSVEPSTSASIFIKPSSTSLSKDARKPFLPKGHSGKNVPIALIQPLPNKKHKRRSSDSTEIEQKKRKEKHESSESSHHRSRSHTTDYKSSDKSKKSSHRSSSSTSRKETREKIRERVKALHPEPPTVEKKEPKENKVQPKVKVTTKNRGDFLTKLDTSSSTSTSSPSTSNKSKPDDQPVTTSKTSSHKSEPKSEPGEHTSSVYKPKVHRIAHTSGESDSSKIPPTSPTNNDEIPVRPSRPHFPKLPITSSSKSMNKSILKKPEPKVMYEDKLQRDKSKKVRFPDAEVSGCKEIDKLDDGSELTWRKRDLLIRDCSAEFNLALSIILNWNVKWLQEQQKHTAPPPLYPTAYDNGNISNAIEKYREELKYSMFHQLWKQMFGNWNTPNNDNLPLTQNPNSCDCIIEIEKVEMDPKDSTNSLLMIYAKCQNPDTSICYGKLSILSFRISKPPLESETKSLAFAYIFSYNKSYDSMGRVCYRIVLKIHAKQFHVVRGQAKLKVLNYARGHLKKFQAFGMTRSCPIIDAICDIHFQSSLNVIKTSDMKNNKNKLLDASQKKAISVSKSCLYKESSVNFIDGPCGTGKTQAIVGLVHELFYSNFNDKILIITVNDKLADDLVYRICKDESIKNVLRFGNCFGMNNNVKHCTFESKVKELLNTEKGKDLVSVEDEIKLVHAQMNCNRFLSEINTLRNKKEKEEIYDKIKRCEKELEDLVRSAGIKGLHALENSPSMFKIKEQLAKARVVETANVIVTSFATCWSSLFENYFIPNSLNRGDITPFSMCIIDDANFHDENSMLIPQILQIPHLVLVGDRNAKLYPNSPYHKILHYFNLNNKDFITCLDEDHRMHADVSCWIREFYNLNTDLKVPISKRNSKFKPFLIIDYISDTAVHNYQTILTDKLAQCILEIEPDRPFGLTIMVTRTFEKENIRSQLTSSNIQNRVRVDFFDGTSTRESDVVIVCLPSTRILDQFLYVALTRAKSTMVVCGDFSKIEPVKAITSLLEYGRKAQVFYSLRSPDLMTPDRLKNILAA